MSAHTPSDALWTRRAFLRTAIAAPLSGTVPVLGPQESPYTILLLGDVHFDRPAHHDMSWLRREKAADVVQVENYTRLTQDVWPRTLERLRARITAGRSSAAPVAFVAQLGDVVEGLCGTAALAERQAQDAVASIRNAALGAPFLFCKGNHDITGPGAKEAFDRVLLPFVRSGMEHLGNGTTCFDAEGASLALACDRDWFLFFDAYDPRALPWLEGVLAKRTARHVFLLLHPPVVPYGARSTWIVYGKSAERVERQRLLDVLGQHGVFVLSAHIHKYSLVVRGTDRGPFVQLALCSVIPSPVAGGAIDVLHSPVYTPEQVRLEASFSPETEAERRAMLASEAPYVRAFEYGDVPGFAAVNIRGAQVSVDMYRALSPEPWRTIDLVASRDGGIPRGRHWIAPAPRVI